MTDIQETIFQSFDIVSLLLIFVFVLFDVKYPRIMEQLRKSPPPLELEKAHVAFRRDVWSSLFVNVLPLAMIDGVLIYLLLPISVQVLKVYQPDVWRFNFIQTAFLLVMVLIGGLFGWAFYLGVLHLRLLRKQK
jgi:hypothetical protein